MRKIRIILIISIFVLLFYTSFIILNKEETVFINIRGNNLVLKVSDSKFEKEMGLSNTKKITHDGMFFIFDNSDFYQFLDERYELSNRYNMVR
jgi:hypothetical protein